MQLLTVRIRIWPHIGLHMGRTGCVNVKSPFSRRSVGNLVGDDELGGVEGGRKLRRLLSCLSAPKIGQGRLRSGHVIDTKITHQYR